MKRPRQLELPADYALRMAVEKAENIAGRMLKSIIASLSMRRCVCFSGRYSSCHWKAYITKAETAHQARDCLKILSGRRHRVYGGVALHLPNGQLRQRVVKSHVRFRRLSALDIEQYIDSGDWQR